MSTTVTFFEQLHIGAKSPKGAELIQSLSDYIFQFNEMKGMENLDIIYLELRCGAERVTIEDKSEAEPGNTWMNTSNGLAQHCGQHMIWNQDHPLIKLVKEMKSDQEIVFRLTGSMTRLYGTSYTYNYWLPALEGINQEDQVDYRCAEAADTDECVWAYHLNGNSTDQVPRDQSPDLVSDIPCWYGENFSIKISTDDEDIFDEFEERIGESLQNLIDDLEDEYLEPDVSEGEAELSGSLEIRTDQLPGLLTSLQAVAEAAQEMNAALECACELLPTERTSNGIEPFAVLRIAVAEGRIHLSACRFDQ